MGIRWCVAWPLSTRHVEEFLKEPRVYVNHYTINRDVALPLISSRQ
jgi:transposase-like protein